ncbi:NAD-dependent epimerase/dehydratase family protein [Phytomonospora endophytica]|uniref:Nucleoside-diphosphate-sugar epimerase n=1 Tax=Phytomonospora endophytica TaxID=714109 RepID=A0A841FVW6_9ACTN|nr:NAD(P)-dependent oxidoreductase [Phytomonospora endophytica]MBB6037878.1 nucleoside-diphosphate-sugar epimerase [Phytomonospora endophytica]GIG68777.1 NAD-dependent epimerase [Phytomonospora endophytica]
MTTDLNGAHVLVTGASGRIGTVTVPHLRELGAHVTTLSIAGNPGLEADRVLVGDTRSQDDVADALDGIDLVVHLAALAHRDIAPPYDVYSTNVVSTFNVLAQAGAAGIGRAVVAGSINSYGLPMNRHPVHPAYFPLDTDIPVDISDWYSLSKRNDENTARMAWRQWGIDIITLRFPHVHDEAALREHARFHHDHPHAGVTEAWSYLTTTDAARAIALSLTATTTGAHAFFLAAGDTLAPYRTEDLLTAHAPDVPRLRRFIDREVPIDLTPARSLIGFEAHHLIDLPTLDLPA